MPRNQCMRCITSCTSLNGLLQCTTAEDRGKATNQGWQAPAKYFRWPAGCRVDAGLQSCITVDLNTLMRTQISTTSATANTSVARRLFARRPSKTPMNAPVGPARKRVALDHSQCEGHSHHACLPTLPLLMHNVYVHGPHLRAPPPSLGVASAWWPRRAHPAPSWLRT